MGKKFPIKWDFRDVSTGIQAIRQFLLGRKYVLHNRFPPLISPRSIPPPDVPRGPEYKYSDQWYAKRNVLNSVKPPVVVPIAEGRKPKDNKPDKVKSHAKTLDTQSIEFPSLPIPGCVWWFDSHRYYKEVSQTPCDPSPNEPCEPPPPPPSPCEPPPCPAEPVIKVCAEEPPCKLEPCKVEKPEPPPPPPKPCDPCKDPKKC